MKTKEAEQIFLEIRSFPCTPEMLSVFIAGQPTAWYCRLMIQACGDFARTPEITTRALAAA